MSYFTDDTVVFYNGEWINAKDAQTSVYAQTLHYGNAVFEMKNRGQTKIQKTLRYGTVRTRCKIRTPCCII